MPYDINFCFRLPQVLENDRVKLTPFIPSEHAHGFIAEAVKYPEMFEYLPFGPFTTVDDLLDNLVESRIRPDPGYTLLVVFDKTVNGSEKLAGLFGLINSSAENLLTEIGCIMILPPFQRTHIASNATGILLHYALDLPSKGGLGLRRVFWQANALNHKSIRLAERMGFRMESIMRWERVLPEGRKGNGVPLRNGDPRQECAGRNTAMLSLCWDDWEAGAYEKVDAEMKRKN